MPQGSAVAFVPLQRNVHVRWCSEFWDGGQAPLRRLRPAFQALRRHKRRPDGQEASQELDALREEGIALDDKCVRRMKQDCLQAYCTSTKPVARK